MKGLAPAAPAAPANLDAPGLAVLAAGKGHGVAWLAGQGVPLHVAPTWRLNPSQLSFARLSSCDRLSKPLKASWLRSQRLARPHEIKERGYLFDHPHSIQRHRQLSTLKGFGEFQAEDVAVGTARSKAREVGAAWGATTDAPPPAIPLQAW